MIRAIAVVIINFMMVMNVYAVDVYGLGVKESQYVLKKYAKEISEYEAALKQESIHHNPFDKQRQQAVDKVEKMLSQKKHHLIDKMIKDNGFLFVDFEVIFYPIGKTGVFYSTLEVIDKEHPKRLRFVNRVIPGHAEQPNPPNVVDAMLDYQQQALRLIWEHKLDPAVASCPVYHCVAGFSHPLLRPYLHLFNEGVIQERRIILETLNHSSDAHRRAAAVFLLGHLQHPQEIIALLLPHIDDVDEEVRNNVMRVIAETVARAQMIDVDVRPFLNALDSPYTSDRNKALYVLSTLVASDEAKRITLQLSGDNLLALMRLQQPNNHDLAYAILKKISGKDFGVTNIAAWSAWVASARLVTV